jgi:hypothetical protein
MNDKDNKMKNYFLVAISSLTIAAIFANHQKNNNKFIGIESGMDVCVCTAPEGSCYISNKELIDTSGNRHYFMRVDFLGNGDHNYFLSCKRSR